VIRETSVFHALIRVTLRPSILDPQGKAVEHAIASLGVKGVAGVRMGKYIDAKIDADSEAEARRTADEICRKLLANPVMEDFTYELVQDE
jgi:phosphoribosylformylglycinamidine synthase PurS subunit